MILRKPFRYTFKYITLYLLVANLIVYFLTSINYELTLVLGLFPPTFLRYKFLWQPITYMFVHGSLPHLIFNMLSLFIFGMAIEKNIGSKEFLLFYMLCGILSGIFSLLTYLTFGIVTLLVGASGALYALLFLFAVMFPRSVIYIWGIIPVPSPILIVIYAAIALFNQLSGGMGTVAHLTHLWGFAVAWIYVVVRMGIHPIKLWKDIFKR